MDTDLKKILGFEEPKEHNRVTISLASSETVLSWSRGEVKTPETINYRTLKPERGGLFCERIFGPTRDWECNCGRYKRMKHQGVVCDYCGVEVTRARVRRERMGHITLAAPVTHIWFSKCTPSRLGAMLDMTVRELERVIYYERWIVTDPGDTPLEIKQLLDDDHYREARELYGDAFKANLGAEAIEDLLKSLKLDELYEELKIQMGGTKSKANRKKIAKRMRLVEGFMYNNQRPEWMILRVLPVIPPDLRPLVALEGGRFASSDLNDLYRRVINRNTRLRNLLQLKTPDVIIRNEKRMLQEAVDTLLDNGRHGRPVTGTNNRSLKSLSDVLKGKQGRFRQNLLGKRVDYSGRSVIVVGPFLKLHQAGLPKEMALTLFEPFIMRRLKELGYVHTVRSAKKMIERKAPVVWDILEEVIKGHPILLNRAPTLHRLSIQAFEPVLIEGKAIRLHPLVCAAYNADFDGDQMAVHVPLSNEAQMETRLLMLAPNNIFSPANGKPITTPSQDITLGSYYLTYESPKFKEEIERLQENAKIEDLAKRKPFLGRTFTGYHEALFAYENKFIKMHDPIQMPNPDYNKEPFPAMGDRAQAKHKLIITTIGRCIFNEIWPRDENGDIGFYNKQVGKKQLGELIKVCYDVAGRGRVVTLLDDLKDLGYAYAMQSGISMAIKDMIIPEEKKSLVDAAEEQITLVRNQRNDGLITETERYNKCIDIWTQCNSELAGKLIDVLRNNNGNTEEINPVYAMLDSGARGSKDQVRQLGGMRGLMAKPNGEIIERPIIANFREGLSVLEYFISSHGARKGLADTALKTADSGYMTRKLVDAAHDVICVEDDCQTMNGVLIKSIMGQGDDVIVPLKDRIVGRITVNDVISPIDGSIICSAGDEITPSVVEAIDDVDINEITLRSSLTCESKGGICAKCYGRHLATGNFPEKGDSLGIIAAQSIGEPGTQLTMRTFHVGGTASASFRRPELVSKIGGKLRYEEIRCVKTRENFYVVLNKNGHVILEDLDGNEVERFDIIMGSQILKAEGEVVEAGEVFAKWDPYNTPIIAKSSGKLKFADLIEGITMRRERSATSGGEEMTVLEHREDLNPQLVVVGKKGVEENYSLPTGAHIMLAEGVAVKEGDTIAKVPRQQQKNKDITGGLPRIAELFEARRPKEATELSRIDGIVELGDARGVRRKLTVTDLETGVKEEHTVSATKRILVLNGDFVHRGQPLTEGNIVPQELLDVCGPRALQEYLVNQVQEVYRLQGVEINDKHIEIIVRQMMRKVRIIEPGDSTKFLYGETVDATQFMEENNRILNEGGRPAEAQPILLGITKASLETDSFISAASFQDTTRVLTEAATQGRVDYLRGFKENVIMGQLIPAGTGYHELADLKPIRHVIGEEEVIEETEQDKNKDARQLLGL